MSKHIQSDLTVEGRIKSNSLINGLNTTLFKDVGIDNEIKININGYVNLKEIDIVKSLDVIKDIPLMIRKKGNLGNFTSINLQIGSLPKIKCFVKTKSGIVDTFKITTLKDGDIFTAVYDGTRFILSGVNFAVSDFETGFSDLKSDINGITAGINQHIGVNVDSQTGVHGIRYYNGNFEYWINGDWKILNTKGIGLNFNWNGTKLGLKLETDLNYPPYVDLKGDKGDSFQYDWNSTNLGVKTDKESNFNYVNLKGDRGHDIQYQWNSTKLGVKTSNEEIYKEVELKGERGNDARVVKNKYNVIVPTTSWVLVDNRYEANIALNNINNNEDFIYFVTVVFNNTNYDYFVEEWSKVSIVEVNRNYIMLFSHLVNENKIDKPETFELEIIEM